MISRVPELAELAEGLACMQYVISSKRDGGTRSLHLGGEIDLAADPELRKSIATALSDDVTALVIDLTDVTFLDCAGIGTLVYGRRLAGEQHCSFRIVHAYGMPLLLLNLTGILDSPE
jgi:anti-anti-sigma factor